MIDPHKVRCTECGRRFGDYKARAQHVRDKHEAERRPSARDAYDVAGCDGESIAADFIAMEMAGYGPDEHGDFLMDVFASESGYGDDEP